MPDIVLQREEKNWIRYIKQRIKKNKNFICFISGPTGSGKSYSSLRIAEELDPEFSLERVVFNGIDLMKLVNSTKLKSGSVIVFEEVGVELNNRNWQSTINKMLNYLMQTFRHRNFILIMNSPYMDFVDSSIKKLFHAEIQTISIDFKKNQVRLKPQLIQYNSRLKKFYYKYLRAITKQGVMPVKIWRVDKPSKDLTKEYEEKKLAFTKSLNEDILEQLKSKSKVKRYPMKCLKCGYKWNAISKQPEKCPSCRKNPY